MATKQTMVNYMQETKNDELYTPYEAVAPLLEYIPKGSKVWECTDFGDSNITRSLINEGFEVIKTHKENFNFLTKKADFDFDVIITNPPYSLKDEFISRCYRYGKPFALLLPLTALEGVHRGVMYREHGIEVLVLDRRINFLKDPKKTNWFNTSWFCHKILPTPLIFKSIGRISDEESASLNGTRKQYTIYDWHVPLW